MFYFKYTKNELHKYFQRFCIGNQICFTICRNFKNAYFTEHLATGFYWLPGFSNKINATRYSLLLKVALCKSKYCEKLKKKKKYHASMNDYNYCKLRLSLKAVSLQICSKKFCNNSVCDKLHQCLVCFVSLKIQAQKKNINGLKNWNVFMLSTYYLL